MSAKKCPYCQCPEKNISETHWLCGTHIATSGRRTPDPCMERQYQNTEKLLRQLVAAVRFHQHNEEMEGDTASSRFDLMYAAEEAHSFLTGEPMSFDGEEVTQ